jgi:hypothetical protein
MIRGLLWLLWVIATNAHRWLWWLAKFLFCFLGPWHRYGPNLSTRTIGLGDKRCACELRACVRCSLTTVSHCNAHLPVYHGF